MSINLNSLELIIQQKLKTTTDPKQVHLLVKALEKIQSGLVYVSSAYNDLPSVSENTGQIYFVLEDERLYWSTGEKWIALASTDQATVRYAWGDSSFNNFGMASTNEFIRGLCYSSPVEDSSNQSDWKKISSGNNQITQGLTCSGEIFSWGYTVTGSAGTNDSNSSVTPRQEITSATDWCDVLNGGRSAHALKTNNTLWSWGSNICGKFGTNNTIDYSSPVQEITSATNWCSIGRAQCSAYATKTNGTLYALGGINTRGILGVGDIINYSSPVQEASSATNWCFVAGGAFHAVGLKTDGTLWAWGCSGNGQVTVSTGVDRSSPVQESTSATDWCCVVVGCRHNQAIKTDGTLFSWGYYLYGLFGNNDGGVGSASVPVQELTSATDWCQLDTPFDYNEPWTSAVKTNGTLWSWGHLCDGLSTQLDQAIICYSSPVQEITSSTNWCFVTIGGSGIPTIQALKTKSY